MRGKTGRYVLASACVLAVGVPSVAIGFGEGRVMRMGERNPSQNGTRALGAETQIIADTATYGTRQSNKRVGDGGGAIYGCRSNPGTEPCIRSNNLQGGRAFEFVTKGSEAGRIELGDAGGAPFTTNATGVATGLNADRVDGREAADFAAAGDLLFAVVDDKQALGPKRGAVGAALADGAKNTVAVTFDRDVKDCSYSVSPSGTAAAEPPSLAVAPAGDAKTVLVDRPDDSDDGDDANDPALVGFHLQVVC